MKRWYTQTQEQGVGMDIEGKEPGETWDIYRMKMEREKRGEDGEGGRRRAEGVTGRGWILRLSDLT